MSEISTRRERREQLREERHQRHRPPPPRRGKSRTGLWLTLGILAAVVALVVGARATGFLEPGAPPVDLNDPRYDPANEVIGQRSENEGNAHIQAGQKGTYQNTPPTSGPHWGSPAAPTSWGIKEAEIADEVTTHNLEHGGIIISYKALTAEQVRQLKDLVALLRQNGFNKIVLRPYSKMNDARIALSAWQWQLKLPNYDDVQIVKFVRSHYEGPDAPEPKAR